MVNKKIAVIDDDEFLRKVYENTLPKEGFSVVTAEDGKAGLELIKKEKPDLVLLDLIMPVMNGFEVLEALKANTRIKIPKIVILSNLGQDKDIIRSKELGATDYLIKSNFSIKEIVEKVKQYLA